MTSEWIEAVWERGKLDNIHATDPQFARFGFRLSLESLQFCLIPKCYRLSGPKPDPNLISQLLHLVKITLFKNHFFTVPKMSLYVATKFRIIKIKLYYFFQIQKSGSVWTEHHCLADEQVRIVQNFRT
jgi:hypothetical protein